MRSRTELRKLLCPRVSEFVPALPTEKQAAFLLLDAREALYGGAAGGGKSQALLMAALQFVDVPGYSALLLRRTLRDLALPGALLDRAREWLTGTPATWNENQKTWTFPSGATLAFGYLDRPADRFRYQSSEFQFIGFDELTQFGETEYTYLFSRLRRLSGHRVPLRMRAASNPGGIGHDWVKRRFLLEGRSHGRIFIPARIDDNPHLDREAYIESLESLEPLVREQLLRGDWDAEDDGIIPYEDILACEADGLWPGGEPPVKNGRGARDRHELYLGVDIGRTRDRTVVWTWERIGDVLWCREVLVLENAPFSEQRDAIRRRLRHGVVSCAVDKGGIGFQLAEELTRLRPDVVSAVQLTGGVQGRLARRLAVAFAERKLRIPADAELRSDLRLVRRTRVVGGVDRIETSRGPSGHADRFWAAALALEASAAHEPPPRASLPRSFPSFPGRRR